MNELKSLLKNMFNLAQDQADMPEIQERIKSGSQVRGTNMCILILAMFIASIGLNMNSTAVIIGAMLISPLMGCIMGIGYGFASYDMKYAKNAFLGFLFEVLFCVLTSTLYFKISPITSASSEILARTAPTIWDVLIAIFGGFAGVIGTTRVEKTNVLPGVAIATALMPPLCTAGYGIAHGNWTYFGGAMYLFFINTFFICLSTIVFLKIIRIPTKAFVSKTVQHKQQFYIALIGIITILPSIYMGYQIVQKTIQTNNYNNYINEEFDFESTQVVSAKLYPSSKTIQVAVIGKRLEDDVLEELQTSLASYHLSDYQLDLTQTEYTGGVSKEDVESLISTEISDFTATTTAIKQEEENTIEDLQAQINIYKPAYADHLEKESQIYDLADQICALYPKVITISGGYLASFGEDGLINYDTFVVETKVTEELTEDEIRQLQNWLLTRVNTTYIKILTEVVEPTESEDTITENINSEAENTPTASE